MKIKRATISEVEQKALPIMLNGYNKRQAKRSTAEELRRSPEKVARDKRFPSKPRISPI